jgi:Protein of unknown function (DUF1153)
VANMVEPKRVNRRARAPGDGPPPGGASGAQSRTILSVADLPPPNPKRWVVARKATVVGAVRDGILSVDEACRRYSLSIEEFLSWRRLVECHGIAGLRVTRLKDYRSGELARNRAGGTSAGTSARVSLSLLPVDSAPSKSN